MAHIQIGYITKIGKCLTLIQRNGRCIKSSRRTAPKASPRIRTLVPIVHVLRQCCNAGTTYITAQFFIEKGLFFFVFGEEADGMLVKPKRGQKVIVKGHKPS